MIVILLLVAAAVALLIGELLLPTHGVLGLVGLACLAFAVAMIFRINRWAGLIIFLSLIIVSPFVIALAVRIWARTPVGRGIILAPQEHRLVATQLSVGDVGTAVTELRPMGECDFSGQTLEVISELGIIRPGQRVKVVSIDHGRATVRAVDA